MSTATWTESRGGGKAGGTTGCAGLDQDAPSTGSKESNTTCSLDGSKSNLLAWFPCRRGDETAEMAGVGAVDATRDALMEGALEASTEAALDVSADVILDTCVDGASVEATDNLRGAENLLAELDRDAVDPAEDGRIRRFDFPSGSTRTREPTPADFARLPRESLLPESAELALGRETLLTLTVGVGRALRALRHLKLAAHGASFACLALVERVARRRLSDITINNKPSACSNYYL